MKTHITKVVETIEVRDSHVAWCVDLWIKDYRNRQKSSIAPAPRRTVKTIERYAHEAVARSLGVQQGDISLAVVRHREALRKEDGE